MATLARQSLTLEDFSGELADLEDKTILNATALEQRLSSQILQTQEQIQQSVSEQYFTKDETNTLISQVSTAFTQTAEGWQISQLTGQASSLIQTGMTLSVDLSGTPLTSDTAYIVMSTRNGGGNTNSNLLFSMSATAEDVVPEPATASLSLLGLSLLMLRRKR